MWDVGGIGQVPDGNFSCRGTQRDGLRLLRVDRWWSNGLTVGKF